MEKVVQACSRVSAAVMTAERGARPAEVIFYLLIYGWNKSAQSTSDYLTGTHLQSGYCLIVIWRSLYPGGECNGGCCQRDRCHMSAVTAVVRGECIPHTF